MTKSIMFLGTGSDVGKSITTAAFCRILKRRGYNVAPFKAQNMSNNSYVTVEGGEIGRAQVVQAEAAGLLPSIHMNPVLLKPSTEMGAQIVLQGKVFSQMDAAKYHEYKPLLRKSVMESYNILADTNDIVVMEGAGSCCEMNLKKNDLVNLPMAERAGAACILVADIDRGGVFSQLIGSYDLMTSKEKKMIIGFIINKFRGDPALFIDGIKYIEKKTGKPVLGLVPYFHEIQIDSEDSVAVQYDKLPMKPVNKKTVNIAVIRLPAISNFTDLEILNMEKDVVVNYLTNKNDLTDDYDCLIMPGTKNVMEDMAWLSGTGWKKRIKEFALKGKSILGICGGYQILGKKVYDPYGVESRRKKISGLGILPVETTLEADKVVRKVTGRSLKNNKSVTGYEIHMGQTKIMNSSGTPFLRLREENSHEWFVDGCYIKDVEIAGTYLHGVFDSPGFRGEFLNNIRRKKRLKEKKAGKGRMARFREYDHLADHFEKYCDVEKIILGAGLKAQGTRPVSYTHLT
ncbi:MAG: cobyric acid synthase, partial [Methanosarcina sp.]|nr:cobyric acid synthase [Methanosarcina sp.]